MKKILSETALVRSPAREMRGVGGPTPARTLTHDHVFLRRALQGETRRERRAEREKGQSLDEGMEGCREGGGRVEGWRSMEGCWEGGGIEVDRGGGCGDSPPV